MSVPKTPAGLSRAFRSPLTGLLGISLVAIYWLPAVGHPPVNPAHWPGPQLNSADNRAQSTSPSEQPEQEALDAAQGEKASSELPADSAPAAAQPAPSRADKAKPSASACAPGNPAAPHLMSMLRREVQSSLKTRGIEGTFAQLCRYIGAKLDSTAGDLRTSEVTGNCRLGWFDHLLRNPLAALAEAEQFTRELHAALCRHHEGLDEALRMGRQKMDCPARPARSFPEITSSEQALEVLKQALSDAQAGYAAALAPLSRSEIAYLRRYLYPVLCAQNREGHTLVDRYTGRRLCDLLEKIDRGALFSAAEALVPLVDPELLKQLAALPDQGDIKAPGATGRIVRKIVTPAGNIVIGGKGKNTYQLDKMEDTSVLIDLGGDDLYLEGTVWLARPVLILIDLAGNDKYQGSQPGIQGGAVLGVSMLVDAAGDDVYAAQDVAQGSAIGGVGILVDAEGDDWYAGVRRVQAQALGGIGILLDRAGRDRYHAAMWAQGFGGPLGLAVLDDLAGNDHYYAGGLYYDSYPETPGYEGWSQGVGAGLRQVANGGIGVILDGGGDDIYEFDYISHGGGYWLGVGFARDFGGNDRRLGATRTAYSGGPRGQALFQRFSNGFGCHYALGFLLDDAGDDTYGGTIMGLGFGWDAAVGLLCDFGGNDRYEAEGGGTQGNGAQASLGILFDYTGEDVYLGYGQGYASPSISYHPLPHCGGNFSFLIDYGGKDSYGSGAENDAYTVRGSQGGFLIDRPLSVEAKSRRPHKQASAARPPRS
ncbi:MAG: hypothetical protein ACUVUC_13465 [Thermoguttaceae bacterium]